jgi:hypothetical protein
MPIPIGIRTSRSRLSGPDLLGTLVFEPLCSSPAFALAFEFVVRCLVHRGTRPECVSLLPLTPAATICEHPLGMRQGKTLLLRVSRSRVIDCYCRVTHRRYEAVATAAVPKSCRIGDRGCVHPVVGQRHRSSELRPPLVMARSHAGAPESSKRGLGTSRESVRNAGVVIPTWSRWRRIDDWPCLGQQGVVSANDGPGRAVRGPRRCAARKALMREMQPEVPSDAAHSHADAGLSAAPQRLGERRRLRESQG